MKSKCLALVALATLTYLAGPTNLRAVVVVGSGPDFSSLVIEADSFGAPLIFEYRYTFDAVSPIDTYAMMTAIDAASPTLSFGLVTFGSTGSDSYFLDSITFESITLANTNSPFWAQWVSGGGSGFPAATPIASGAWIEGAGISLPYRTLAPGSWDGFIYNGDFNPDPPYELTSAPPSIAPVPEPTTVAMLVLAAIGIAFRLRRRNA